MNQNSTDIILAIETSTPVCSVALQTANGRITEKRTEGQGVHSEKTFLFIKELLERAELTISDLDSVLFSNGPGSYTGLRIGAAAIKGLLFRKNTPLFTFPTLVSFAAGVLETDKTKTVHAVIDARREHLYWQKVENNGLKVSDAQIIEIEKLEKAVLKDHIIVGTGWERLSLPSQNQNQCIGTEGISAVNLIRALGHQYLRKYVKKEEVETFEPNYLTMSQINNSPNQG